MEVARCWEMRHKVRVQKHGCQWIVVIGLAVTLAHASWAQPGPGGVPGGAPPPSSGPVNRPASPVVQNGDSIRVGDQITATKTGRSISIPGWFNQREGMVEYALVTRSGKVHESLLATDADPKDLNVLLLLFGMVPESIIQKPQGSWVVPSTNAVSIRISWKSGEQEVSFPLEELVILKDVKGSGKESPFPVGAWFYNGSRVIEGGAFLAQTSGSLLSLIFDPDALINNPHADRNDDDIHFANTAKLPPVGTPVTITFRLSQLGLATPAATNFPPEGKPERSTNAVPKAQGDGQAVPTPNPKQR